MDNNRILVNPFGRTRVFMDKWGDELFRGAYAQIPQSTIADQTKYSLIEIKKRASYAKLCMENHDSFLALVPINKIDEFTRVTIEEYEKPIDFKNCSISRGKLIIPIEISIGDKTWGDMKCVVR
jgi:hypothetical protein